MLLPTVICEPCNGAGDILCRETYRWFPCAECAGVGVKIIDRDELVAEINALRARVDQLRIVRPQELHAAQYVPNFIIPDPSFEDHKRQRRHRAAMDALAVFGATAGTTALILLIATA